MGNLFTLFTIAGPIAGGIGFYFGWPILFWIGVALAGLNLFMNLASGAMNFPLFPLIAAGIGGLFLTPWYFGAAAGLLVYTAIEGLGEVLLKIWRRKRSK